MRSLQLRSPSFAAGFTLGLVLSGVALGLARIARRRVEHHSFAADRTVIDGAKPIDPVNLELGPDVEPGAGGAIRLESEMETPRDNSQRW
jgi:hypothetical protein